MWQVSADRAEEPYWQTGKAKCQCNKAETLAARCQDLRKGLDGLFKVRGAILGDFEILM